MPTTSAPEPAISAVNWPVPHPTSRIRSPCLGASRAEVRDRIARRKSGWFGTVRGSSRSRPYCKSSQPPYRNFSSVMEFKSTGRRR